MKETNNQQVEELRKKLAERFSYLDPTPIDDMVSICVEHFTHQLELAKIEAKIEELDYAGKAISEAYVDYRLPELTKQKEELLDD